MYVNLKMEQILMIRDCVLPSTVCSYVEQGFQSFYTQSLTFFFPQVFSFSQCIIYITLTPTPMFSCRLPYLDSLLNTWLFWGKKWHDHTESNNCIIYSNS